MTISPYFFCLDRLLRISSGNAVPCLLHSLSFLGYISPSLSLELLFKDFMTLRCICTYSVL